MKNYICWITALVLIYKFIMMNDVKLSLKDDPMEQWIALGIAFILLIEATRKDRKE